MAGGVLAGMTGFGIVVLGEREKIFKSTICRYRYILILINIVININELL